MAKAKPPSPHDQARELMRRLKAPDQFTKAMLALLERVQGEATSRERAACIAVAENIEKRWRAASRMAYTTAMPWPMPPRTSPAGCAPKQGPGSVPAK